MAIGIDIDTETEEEKTKCPNPQGGWINETDTFVVGTVFKFTEKTFTEHYERLFWRTNAPVVAGVAQTPFANARPEIFGWLKIQMRNQSGSDTAICDVWGKLTLTGGSTIDGNSTKPEYSFRIFPSTLNEYVAGAVLA
jgi:hypothetical protein